MRRLLCFLFGWFRVTVLHGKAEEVLNTLLVKREYSWGYCTAEDKFSLCVGSRGCKILKAAYTDDSSQISFEEYGLPAYLKSLLRRPGMILGCVMAVLIFCLGTQYVWDVRIEGNDELTDDVIEQALSSAGLSVGVRLSDVDRNRVTLAVLENEEGIAHLAINLRGGVAYVNVIESIDAPSAPVHTGGANLVAASDAVIDSLSVRRGEVLVRAGQVVRKGDLLVSGVTDAHAGNRILYAEGEIFGKVQESFTVTVPLKSTETVTTGEKTVGFLINFFGKSINIACGGGNLPPTCGTIYNWERCMLPGNVALPISFARISVPITETADRYLEKSAAVSHAARLANEQLYRQLKDGELLCRTLEGYFTEDAYVLVCEYTCVRNIAKIQEFTID